MNEGRAIICSNRSCVTSGAPSTRSEPRMTRKAILQIGTEKTGTTALQTFLAANRKALAARGFVYPPFCGALDHTGLAAHAMDADRSDSLKHPFSGSAAKELDGSGTQIHCSENWHSRPLSDAEIQRLRDFLDHWQIGPPDAFDPVADENGAISPEDGPIRDRLAASLSAGFPGKGLRARAAAKTFCEAFRPSKAAVAGRPFPDPATPFSADFTTHPEAADPAAPDTETPARGAAALPVECGREIERLKAEITIRGARSLRLAARQPGRAPCPRDRSCRHRRTGCGCGRSARGADHEARLSGSRACLAGRLVACPPPAGATL
ncbi:hypothetical protein JMJ92_18165 [Rhodovulum visakhapatnamense]|uniref:Sulfotransferase family protein n=2 Tax=Rhodovulum visakhapatnamense TaxID=364297 RepID=A0ABS1RK62_9RHOB|nr:hypothetical protein [Rhodovulum visakhapatnamense]